MNIFWKQLDIETQFYQLKLINHSIIFFFSPTMIQLCDRFRTHVFDDSLLAKFSNDFYHCIYTVDTLRQLLLCTTMKRNTIIITQTGP